jgi:SAM-dependent methyltransferase
MILTAQKSELILGAGSRPSRMVSLDGVHGFENPTRLDANRDHDPDVVWDISKIPLPFDPGSFDEIHAYHVLEHVGRQGDWRFFFDQFSDFHRILRPGGLVCGIVPRWDSPWAWGDPSHTRVITSGSLVFLSQKHYRNQVGVTPMSDFRFYYKADFDVVYSETVADVFKFILRRD